MLSKREIALVAYLPLLGCLTAEADGQATIGGDWRADLNAFAQSVIDEGFSPGIGLAVAVGDRVIYAEGFGTADMATGRPVSGDTPFYIASSTKSLTATAAALAVEAGDLEWDTAMTTYLPDAQLADGVGRDRIKVHDLAALTLGLGGGGPVVLRTAYTGQFTRPQLLELLRFHGDTGEYGTFNYNNLGFNLLGMVLESVYEESWKDVVRRLVIEPIGMTSTAANVSEIAPDRIALPHGSGVEGFERIELGKADANMHAAGGHFASARDLARYLAAHMSDGIIEDERVLPAGPLASTHRLQVAQDRQFGPYHRHGWGYGWDIGTFEGDTLIHRFGGFAGYRSHMSFMPEHDIGVVVLVNATGAASAAADAIATYAYERLLGRPDVDSRYRARMQEMVAQLVESRRQLADHLEERRARLAPLSHDLKAFAGTYESPVLGRMHWRVVAGGLEVFLGVAHSRAEVYDAQADQLRIVIGGGQVATFHFPEDGGPARAVTLAGVEFERVAGGVPAR